MGQDVTGLSPSSLTAKLNGTSHDTMDGIYSKSSTESSEPKVTLTTEGLIEDAPDEISNAKLENAKNDVISSVENEETKHVVQNSVNVSDQHACANPIAAESPAVFGNKPPSINNHHSSSSSKKSKSNSSSVSRKHMDDEDNWSTASSTTASARAARTRTTMPVAPKFTVNERLEKRKEFYSKLEEKHKALEAEKHEFEARNKEEQQAAIKQLRKSMVYKANPVPSFYYEGPPPPKKEIKKVPTTRAVSPKLGRRKSCGDAASSSSAEKVVSARTTNRYSLGSKGSVTPTITPKRPSSKGILKKVRPKQPPKESSPAKAPTPDTAPPAKASTLDVPPPANAPTPDAPPPQEAQPDTESPAKALTPDTVPPAKTPTPETAPPQEPQPAEETSLATPEVSEDGNEQKMANLSVQS